MIPKFNIGDLLFEGATDEWIKPFYLIVVDVLTNKGLYVYQVLGDATNTRYHLKFSQAHDRWKKVS